MESVKVIVKPESIPWEDIHQLLVAAHKKNISRGMIMKSTRLSGEELERRVGRNGRCFVALAGEKLVGTTSVGFSRGNHWFDKGRLVAHSMFSALLPKYQGVGILEELYQCRDEFALAEGAEMMEANTPVENRVVRENARRSGFIEVAYRAFPGHISVIFVKWFGKHPFPLWYCRFRFWLSRMKTLVRYNSQGEKRFGI